MQLFVLLDYDEAVLSMLDHMHARGGFERRALRGNLLRRHLASTGRQAALETFPMIASDD